MKHTRAESLCAVRLLRIADGLLHGGAAPGLVGVLPFLWGKCGTGGGYGFSYLGFLSGVARDS